MYNGKPTVFVNGVAQAPLWYSRPERDTQFDQSEMEGLASVGIDTSIAFILPRETLGELWMSDGTIKTETIDQQILRQTRIRSLLWQSIPHRRSGGWTLTPRSA